MTTTLLELIHQYESDHASKLEGLAYLLKNFRTETDDDRESQAMYGVGLILNSLSAESARVMEIIEQHDLPGVLEITVDTTSSTLDPLGLAERAIEQLRLAKATTATKTRQKVEVS